MLKNALNPAIWVLVWALLLFAAVRQCVRVNTTPAHWDQAAVLELSEKIKSTGNPFATDGNRHPLYSLLAAPFVNDTPAGFARAKAFALFVSALFWAVMFLFFGQRAPHWLSAWLALALALPPALSLLFCQFIPDMLFTVFLVLAWYRFARGFADRRSAVTGGVLCGFAFLTKYSGLMLFLVFILCYAVFAGVTFYRKRDVPLFKRHGQTALFTALAFLIVGLPLFAYNARTFGTPFYNVNTRYAWTNSWKEAQAFATRVQDRSPAEVQKPRLAEMDQTEIPSMRNYFRKHSPGAAVFRFKAGIHLNGLVWWKGRLLFFALAAALLFWAVLRPQNRGRAMALRRLKTPAALFSFVYAGVYLTGIFWYAAVAFNLRYVYPVHALLAIGAFLWARGPKRVID